MGPTVGKLVCLVCLLFVKSGGATSLLCSTKRLHHDHSLRAALGGATGQVCISMRHIPLHRVLPSLAADNTTGATIINQLRLSMVYSHSVPSFRGSYFVCDNDVICKSGSASTPFPCIALNSKVRVGQRWAEFSAERPQPDAVSFDQGLECRCPLHKWWMVHRRRCVSECCVAVMTAPDPCPAPKLQVPAACTYSFDRPIVIFSRPGPHLHLGHRMITGEN